MPKRKLSQVAVDSIKNVAVNGEAVLSSLPIKQSRRRAKSDINVTEEPTPPGKATPNHNIQKDISKDLSTDSDSPLSDLTEIENVTKKPVKLRSSQRAGKKASKDGSARIDKPKPSLSNDIIHPENLPSEDAESCTDDEEIDEAKIQEASLRPPPVNSSYLPLPWKGRLGYVSSVLFAEIVVPRI